MKQPKNVIIPFSLFYCLLDYFESDDEDRQLFEVCRDALRTKCDSLLKRELYSQLLSARDPSERARLAGEYMLACAGIFGDDGSEHQSDGSEHQSDGSEHQSDGSDGSQHQSDGSDGSQHQSDGSSFGCDPHCSAYGLERDELCSSYCCPIYDRSF